MPKVRIQFRTSNSRTSYWSDDLRISDGETATIDRERAQRLMKAFPGNFKILGPIPRSRSLVLPKQAKPLTKLISHPLVSILIPQRGRPAYIKKCLELILQNTSYPNYEVIVIYDRDDADSIKQIPKGERIKLVVDPSPTRQMFVGKINYGFRISKAEYIVYLANDIEVDKNWLNEAMKSMLGVFTDSMGLVTFNHGDGSEHAHHGLISRKFVDRYLGGNILYPDYVHFWSDVELLHITKELNRFYLCSTSKIVHISPKDNLHDEAWKKTYESGRELLVRRQKLGFPE